MILGRIIFGIGGECLSAAKSKAISKWFYDDLNFVFGWAFSLGHLGGVLNSVLTPSLNTNYGISFATFIGLVTCIVGLALGLLFSQLDLIADRQEGVIGTL